MENKKNTKNMDDKKNATTCTTCNAGQAADVFCLDCKEHLCQSCHTSHMAFKAMKHHKIVSVEDLQSGKIVSLTNIATEDQHCSEHDGETKRFYCKTCVKLVCRDCVVIKQCCRDHQYVTLSEAAQKHTHQLKKMLDQSKAKQRQCEDAIRKTEKVEEDFKTASKTCHEVVGNLRNEYVKMLDKIFSSHENDLKIVEIEKARELYSIKTELMTQLDQIKKAVDVTTAMTKMETDYKIVSQFTSLSQNLQGLLQTQPILADDTLGQIQMKIPIVSFHSSRSWKKVGKFTTKPWVYYPHAIAIHSDGDIALASSRNVQVFSRSGGLLYSFKTTPCHQVIVTEDKKYLLNHPEEITCFDYQNKQKSTIQITDGSKQPMNPVSLSVDPNGRIIAASGSSERSPSWFGYISSIILSSTQLEPIISIHKSDGSFISSFKPASNPRYIAVTASQDIVATFDDGSLQLISYSGNNIRVLAPPPEVQQWLPQNVCYVGNHLFVANLGAPMAVYVYTISGIYQGLVASLAGFQPPVDMAAFKDAMELQLFVVDRKGRCVQIYKA